ncbi:helix-turn-helix domain-containing protein [Streptomyces sp. G6]|uniref:helix-turn-helix domain-containing protein n=1 Tax=Streptomyces sp. G6 TaxID=1178736 RepID=UPI003ED9AC25
MTVRPCRFDDCPNPAAPHRKICWTHKNRLYRARAPHLKIRNLTEPDTIPPVVEDRLPDHGLTYTDRRTAARQLLDAGVHPAEIAQLIGVTERTVYRWKAESRGPRRHLTAVPDQPAA